MGHEQPEWVDRLVLELEEKARAARQHAAKLDRQKHAMVKSTYNTEAGLYLKFAEMLQDAWQAESSIASNLFDRLRTDLESLLVLRTIATHYAPDPKDGYRPVRTAEAAITHHDIRMLLAKYPRRFPDLEDDEETLG
jgi:hypothetical protein